VSTAAIFSGKPEAIVLAGLGSVIPDLDRSYWFIPKKKVAEEEYHRALLHNIVVLALMYLVNRYLALGVFSHLMLDSMTTVKDRGVEWLFPVTRVISKDYWSQAEVQVEPLVWIPWRRTYGPALNGHMLDTYVFLCSSGVLVLWSVLQGLHHYLTVTCWFNAVFVVSAGTIFLLYASGECYSNWAKWSKTKKTLAAISIGIMLLCVFFAASFLHTQGAILSWNDFPNDWLLRTNKSLNTLFLASSAICSLIILRFLRAVSIVLANFFPALCTRMPSRDFIMDEKKGTSDVFV
jgi:hypothetical protein